MKKKEKVIYYKDELNDEFAGDSIVAKKIDANYVYLREQLFWKSGSYILVSYSSYSTGKTVYENTLSSQNSKQKATKKG